MKYVPFTTAYIDDEFGVQHVVEYDEDTMYDTYEEAENALDEIMEQSDGGYGVLAIENGEIVHRYNCGEDDGECDYDEPWDLEVGFNPYMGCYDFDC